MLYFIWRFTETDDKESTETELLVNESAVAHTLLYSASHKHCSGLVIAEWAKEIV